jgi:hypothetical protein
MFQCCFRHSPSFTPCILFTSKWLIRQTKHCYLSFMHFILITHYSNIQLTEVSGYVSCLLLGDKLIIIKYSLLVVKLTNSNCICKLNEAEFYLNNHRKNFYTFHTIRWCGYTEKRNVQSFLFGHGVGYLRSEFQFLRVRIRPHDLSNSTKHLFK